MPRLARPARPRLAPLALALAALLGGPVAAQSLPALVISQVYGGGGNSGATLNKDYVEIFNRGSSAVSLDGWSLQYASSTGTGSHHLAFGVIDVLDPLGSTRLGIDAVRLAAPVPEPKSWALMAAGLAAIGFTAQRRRRS